METDDAEVLVEHMVASYHVITRNMGAILAGLRFMKKMTHLPEICHSARLQSSLMNKIPTYCTVGTLVNPHILGT